MHDISDPTAPLLKDSLELNDDPRNIDTVGNYAYVSCHHSTKIINISDPSNLIIEASIDISNGWGLKVVNEYAYVADASVGLKIIDISNPSNDTALKGMIVSEYTMGIFKSSNYLYLAINGGGMKIMDISDQLNPALISHIDIDSTFARNMYVSGNYAYVRTYDNSIKIIDILQKSNPLVVGSIATEDNYSQMQVVNNYAYIANGTEGMKIVDISTPSNPVFVSNVSSGAYTRNIYF